MSNLLPPDILFLLSSLSVSGTVLLSQASRAYHDSCAGYSQLPPLLPYILKAFSDYPEFWELEFGSPGAPTLCSLAGFGQWRALAEASKEEGDQVRTPFVER